MALFWIGFFYWSGSPNANFFINLQLYFIKFKVHYDSICESLFDETLKSLMTARMVSETRTVTFIELHFELQIF